MLIKGEAIFKQRENMKGCFVMPPPALASSCLTQTQSVDGRGPSSRAEQRAVLLPPDFSSQQTEENHRWCPQAPVGPEDVYTNMSGLSTPLRGRFPPLHVCMNSSVALQP